MLRRIRVFSSKNSVTLIGLLIIPIVVLDKCCNVLDGFINGEDIEILPDLCATFIGFILTALTVFISLPKDNRYMQNFKKYGHTKRFAHANGLSFCSFVIYLLLWMVGMGDNRISIYICIYGMLELLLVFWCAYQMAIYSFWK